MTQTWWLSFCDPTRPDGDQHLGVVVVDVAEADVAAARPLADAIRAAHGRPPLDDDAAWMAGAIHITHATGCNPGGEVAAVRLDQAPAFALMGPRYPRNRVLSIETLAAIAPVMAIGKPNGSTS